MTSEEIEPEQPTWRRPRRWPFVLLGIAVLFVIVLGWAGAYANAVWFDSVGYGDVYGTLGATKAGMFAAAALLTAATMTVSIKVASRTQPPEVIAGGWVERYRAYAEPVRMWIWIGLTVVAALTLGAAQTGHWRDLLLWWQGGSFDAQDPWFHHDIGFYVFTLPWWNDLVGFGLTLGFLALATSVTAQYFYGGITLTPAPRWTRAAQRQIAVTAAVTLVFKAIGYWLSRYDIVHAGGPYATGLGYVDQHATVPGREILAYAALICAALLVWQVRRPGWRTPVTAVILLFVSSVTLGLIWPAILQSSVVRPNPIAHERDNLTDSIAATRNAYGLGSIATSRMSGAARVADVPILDPDQVRAEIQAGGTHATEPEADRYLVGGQSRPVWTSMAQLPGGAEVVAAYADARDHVGKDRPVTTWAQDAINHDLAPTIATPLWISPDAPSTVVADTAPGVALTATHRFAYALANGDVSLLAKHGTLAMRLDPTQRVGQIAPWLQWDRHPYLTLVGGRALWVLDGYTTTGDYPGSAVASWAAMTGDGSAAASGGYDTVNYVRNAVKATVDATDGTVRLYEWDSDPILRSWEGIFPGLIHAKAEIAPELSAHLRYPTDLFAAQRFQARAYAMATPESLLAARPMELPTLGDGMTWAAPQRLWIDGVWSIASPMVAANGDDLAGVLVANSDATSAGYGRLRLLTPADTAHAPSTINAIMRAAPAVRAAIAALPASATARWGPLDLVAPGRTVVWAAPLYATSTDATKAPALVDIVVSLGNVVGVGVTLPEALADAAKQVGIQTPTAAALVHDAEALLAQSEDENLTPRERDVVVRQAQAKLSAAFAVLTSEK